MFSNKTNVLQVISLLRSHGIYKFVLCPGSRDIPLIQTILAARNLEAINITDERSAGFYALGWSLQAKAPVVVVVTSGSALLNLHPAVSEAFYQQVPLVILSADRPAAWIGQMDGQTLPQSHVFHSLVKKSVTLQEVHCPEDEWFNNRLINEAILELDHHTCGPVHINIPISEPFFDFSVRSMPRERVIERITIPASGQSYTMPRIEMGGAATRAAPRSALEAHVRASEVKLGSALNAEMVLRDLSDEFDKAESPSFKEPRDYRALMQVVDNSSARILERLVHKPRIMLLIGQDQWQLLSRAISAETWLKLSTQVAIVNENISNLCWDSFTATDTQDDDGIRFGSGFGPIETDSEISGLFNFTPSDIPAAALAYQFGCIEHIDAILATQEMNPFVPPSREEQREALEWAKKTIMEDAVDGQLGRSYFSFDFAETARDLIAKSLVLKVAAGVQYDLEHPFQPNIDVQMAESPEIKQHIYTRQLRKDEFIGGGLECPDVVITVGGHIISKRLKKFLRAQKVEHYHVSPTGEVVDLFGTLSTVIEMDTVAFIKLLYQSLCFLSSLEEQDSVVLPLTPKERDSIKRRQAQALEDAIAKAAELAEAAEQEESKPDGAAPEAPVDADTRSLKLTDAAGPLKDVAVPHRVDGVERERNTPPEMEPMRTMSDSGDGDEVAAVDYYKFGWGRTAQEELETRRRFIAAIRLAVLDNERKRQSYPVTSWPYSQMRAIVELLEQIPPHSVVHLANSSTVRYAQMAGRKDLIYQSNRGVNGIEGSLSTALGYAAISPVLNFILIGDLSFFYDMNAMWRASLGGNVRILVLNNSGGEIFHALPGLKLGIRAMDSVTGAHRTSVQSWVKSQGCLYTPVHDKKELKAAWDRFCNIKFGVRGRLGNRAHVMEVFTNTKSDMDALKLLHKHGYF